MGRLLLYFPNLFPIRKLQEVDRAEEQLVGVFLEQSRSTFLYIG